MSQPADQPIPIEDLITCLKNSPSILVGQSSRKVRALNVIVVVKGPETTVMFLFRAGSCKKSAAEASRSEWSIGKLSQDAAATCSLSSSPALWSDAQGSCRMFIEYAREFVQSLQKSRDPFNHETQAQSRPMN